MVRFVSLLEACHPDLRGGSFFDDLTNYPVASYGPLFQLAPQAEYFSWGFRVSQVPGPSSFALLAIGGLGALRRRR